MNDVYSDGESWSDDAIWQHLDYYVRRHAGRLVLVRTMFKREPGIPDDRGEIITFYFDLDELDAEWADAVLEQGSALDEGKSCDFAPPDEDISAFHSHYDQSEDM